jgi:hypothetical protein
VEGTNKKQRSLKKCGKFRKQQYVHLKFANKFWLSAIFWRNLMKFYRHSCIFPAETRFGDFCDGQQYWSGCIWSSTGI